MKSVCDFCNKVFSNKYNLEKHLKSAKFCIKIQQEKNFVNNCIEEFECEHCGKKYINKDVLNKHLKLCNEKIVKSKINVATIEKEQIIEDLQLENNILKDKLGSELKNIEVINKLTEENNKLKLLINENTTEIIIKLREEIARLEVYKIWYEEKKSKVEELERKLDNSYEKSQKTISNLATKAIDKAGGNKIYNKYIQNLVPLTDEYLKEQSKNLQIKHIVDGPDSLAHFASTHSLRDRVICTDVARRNFVFKDETNNIIKDPKGVKITKKFVENNKEELTRLLREYVKSYYDDDTTMTLKEKQELEELLLAIKYCNDPDNADSYNRFEKQFTNCFSKLMFNKNYENLELEEKE